MTTKDEAIESYADDDGYWMCSACWNVVTSLDDRDCGGADGANTFCTQCHHEEEPIEVPRDPNKWPVGAWFRKLPGGAG